MTRRHTVLRQWRWWNDICVASVCFYLCSAIGFLLNIVFTSPLPRYRFHSCVCVYCDVSVKDIITYHSTYFVFSVLLTVIIKCCWLHSNLGSLVWKAIALPTAPQPMPSNKEFALYLSVFYLPTYLPYHLFITTYFTWNIAPAERS